MFALALSLGCAPVDRCDPGNICTVVGTGDLGFNGEGLPPAESWLYLPTAVLLDPDGNLVVVDYNNMRVRGVRDGRLATLVGNGEHQFSEPGAAALDTPLENPVDAAYGPDGLLYVLPAHESRLIRIDVSGAVEVVAGTGVEGYAGDGGLAVDAEFFQPQGFCLDGAGAVWIADTQNGAVRRVAPDGTVNTVLDGLGGPQRTRCGDGRVLVTDTFGGRIIQIEEESLQYHVVADGFTYPWSAVPHEGGALVADSGAHRVVYVDAAGDQRLVAGTGEPGPLGDGGPAVDAQLDWPADVLVAGDDLYVADMQNARVRRVGNE